MKNKIVALIILLFIGVNGFAQDVLTPEQAVEIALKNNYDILIARNNATIADKNNTPGNAGMLPSVGITVGDNFNLNNINQEFTDGRTVVQNSVQSNSANAALVLNWTIFDGLRMFATKRRLAIIEQVGEINFKQQVQNSVGDVLTAYYDIVRQKQQINFTGELIKISEERVKIADSKFNVGATGKSELLQAKVDLNATRALQMNQRNILKQTKATLNQLLAREVTTEFDVNDSIPLIAQPTFAELTTAATTGNLDVQVGQKSILIAQQVKREAAAARWPLIGVNAGYNFANTQNQAGFQLFNRTYGLGVGFTASIPIFNGFNVNRTVKVANIEISSRNLDLENIKLKINQRLVSAYSNWTYGQEVLKLEEDNIKLAKENVDIAVERLKLGQFTSLELRDAQNSYQDALYRLTAARYNAKVAEIELQKLIGTLVK
jgi:outer membrane protein